MILVSTIFGVAHIDRMGIGTEVSKTMMTVTKLEINVILKLWSKLVTAPIRVKAEEYVQIVSLTVQKQPFAECW